MSIAFVTMVWRDYWLLERWIENAERHVPRDNIYVINHGQDPRVTEIAAGCCVMPLPRDKIDETLTQRRWELISGVASGLNGFFDYVVATDVDELLVLNQPGLTLEQYLAGQETSDGVYGAVGLNVMPVEDADTGTDLPVLTRYPFARLSPQYSKPIVTAGPVRYTRGGHGVWGQEFAVHAALSLVHLHYVTPDYRTRMDDRAALVKSVRDADASDADKTRIKDKRFWINWAKADAILSRQLRLYNEAEEVPVDDDFARVAALLNANVVRGRERCFVRSGEHVNYRVRLTPALQALV
ncbi:MAG: hypothetical protein AAF601_11995 [Pseudomonadota bacterium]